MEWDESGKSSRSGKRRLEEWSIEELKVYIETLRVEIERTENCIAQKQAHLTDAGQIFKKQTKT